MAIRGVLNYDDERVLTSFMVKDMTGTVVHFDVRRSGFRVSEQGYQAPDDGDIGQFGILRPMMGGQDTYRGRRREAEMDLHLFGKR